MDMHKIGTALVVTLALASSAAWAQQMGGQTAAGSQSAAGNQSSTSTTQFGFDSTTPNRSGNNQTEGRNAGTQGARGVVTGGSGDGGISLHTDAAKASSNVPAISGGVSLNARDNLRSQERDANVKLVFALNTGNYVSDVQVKVTDSKGNVVIDDVSNGPWVLAKLQPGTYTATATYNGKTVTQKITAGKSGLRTAQFRWPASVESVGAADAAAAGGQILGTGPEEPQR
jgi:hypothetical protein